MASCGPRAKRKPRRLPSAPESRAPKNTAASSTVTGPNPSPAVPLSDVPTAAGGGGWPLAHKCLQPAGDPGQALTGDELDGIDDVGADVSQRSGTRLLLVHPPGQRRILVRQPVLQVLRPDLPNGADGAVRDEASGQRDGRGASVGETHHRLQTGGPRPRQPTIASASATVLANGFSHSTCLPAASAARAISAWVSPGVQMSMRSMSSRATSRQSVSLSCQPNRSAAVATDLIAPDHDRHLGPQRQVNDTAGGAPRLGVRGAHEGVADHRNPQGGRGTTGHIGALRRCAGGAPW